MHATIKAVDNMEVMSATLAMPETNFEMAIPLIWMSCCENRYFVEIN